MHARRTTIRILFIVPVVACAAVAGSWLGRGDEIVSSLWTVGFIIATFAAIGLLRSAREAVWPSGSATADRYDGGTRASRTAEPERTWRTPAAAVAAFALAIAVLVVMHRHVDAPEWQRAIRGAVGLLGIMTVHQLIDLVLSVVPWEWIAERDDRVSIRPRTRRAPSLGRARTEAPAPRAGRTPVERPRR